MAKKKQTTARPKGNVLTVFKCVRADGTDFRTGKVDYAGALERGVCVEVLDAAPSTGNVCGHGLHVSDTPRKTIQFAERAYRPWRWFEGDVAEEDVIEKDTQKMRVRRFWPRKEMFLSDIFGPDFAARIDRVKDETASWKKIPWLKPNREVTEGEIIAIVGRWREAITPWLRDKTYQLPTAVNIIRNRKAAVAAADAAADAAVAAAVAAADAAADVDAADAAVAAADAAVAAADAADAADAYRIFPHWLYWYIRPRYVLWRHARWQMVGMTEPSPWEPLVELFRLGAMPIGYSGGAFVVYLPGKK